MNFYRTYVCLRIQMFLLLIFQIAYVFAQLPEEYTGLSPNWLSEELLQTEEIDETLLHPGNKIKKWELNHITPDELLSLGLLSQMQANQFFLYKKIMGSFKDIYELQAVPNWSPALVRTLLPYFKIEFTPLQEMIKDSRLTSQSIITFRLRGIQNKKTIPFDWVGSGAGLQTFYRYRSMGIQVGMTIEKDPGERLYNPRVGSGVDFLSAYVVVQPKGQIRSIFIGDFSVNFGQGLIQWQSFGFRKTPVVGLLKKQGPTFRPYRSVGEFNFHRGIALSGCRKSNTIDFFYFLSLLKCELWCFSNQWHNRCNVHEYKRIPPNLE